MLSSAAGKDDAVDGDPPANPSRLAVAGQGEAGGIGGGLNDGVLHGFSGLGLEIKQSGKGTARLPFGRSQRSFDPLCLPAE